ncbi:MAG: hypothetical protein ACYDA2_02755 [Acidimicrobiales bacterium]
MQVEEIPSSVVEDEVSFEQAVALLELICATVDDLQRSAEAGRRCGFELGEASYAAHRALLALQGWNGPDC